MLSLIEGRRECGRCSSVLDRGWRDREALREALRMKSFTSRVTLRALLSAREFVGMPLPRVLPLPFLLSERCTVGTCKGCSAAIRCSGGLAEPWVATSKVGDARHDSESGLATGCAVGTGFRSGTLTADVGS